MYRVQIKIKKIILDEFQGVHLSETLLSAYSALWSDYKHNCTLYIYRNNRYLRKYEYRFKNEIHKRIEKTRGAKKAQRGC